MLIGRGGGLKMDWTKPGRFGRAIAYWALNGISRFGFGRRLHTALPCGHLTAGSLPLPIALTNRKRATAHLTARRFIPMLHNVTQIEKNPPFETGTVPLPDRDPPPSSSHGWPAPRPSYFEGRIFFDL